ncbi:helix-turn-helix domain-containing protein [Pseudoalteromonas luteoviolacea]|uniref:helix-turn-helix domain-containing protein n=1 Tax=Pseudoalteromonas luteoviolacea TaxID=43657 RepID=UPI001B39864F|nr:helix-turn-helix transcriptional regulator [Pseudoalteromonas luteoviolacea]MBQ4839824.1 helix-turn-helix transcriptional regulator [Pseudoalteromonas luteoviolacea]
MQADKDTKAFKSDIDLLQSPFDPANVQYMRLSLGMTLRQFAKEVATISHQTVANWESGSTTPSESHYRACVQNYLKKRHNNKKIPLQNMLFNPHTLSYIRSSFRKLNNDEKQDFIKQISDEGDNHE